MLPTRSGAGRTGDAEEERVRLTGEIRYEAAPKRVFRMITDPGFQEAKCAAAGSLEHEVDVTELDDGSTTIFSRRMLSTDQVPNAVRSFLGRTVHLAETQRWEPERADGSRTGSIRVEIEGTPVRYTASTALLPDGEGTHQPIEGDLKVAMPLVGGRLEQAAEPAVRAAIRVEQETGRAWLTEHP
jgi:hypothetical protein